MSMVNNLYDMLCSSRVVHYMKLERYQCLGRFLKTSYEKSYHMVFSYLKRSIGLMDEHKILPLKLYVV